MLRVATVALTVGLIPVPGSTAQSPAFPYSEDFEGPVGAEWSSQGTDTSPSGQRFLGQFGEQTVELSLTNLPQHTSLRVSLDLHIIGSMDGSTTRQEGSFALGPDVFTLALDGAALKTTTFSNVKGSDAYRQAYPGDHPGDLNAAGTGASATNALGYPANNGDPDRFFGDTTYRLEFDVPHSASSATLAITASGVLDPGHTLAEDESWGIDNLEVGSESDRDGDGLLDRWETDGYDDDGDGTIDVDLPAMGADPDRKDIFVELDYMTGRRLDRVAVQAVVDAFERAPVPNPNGVSGIALHVDNGADSEMDPGTHATWGARSRQDVIPTSTDLAPASDATFDWAQTVDPLKPAHFDTPRKRIFHYAISALDTPTSAGGLARGQAAGDIAGSDFVLTMDPSVFGLTQEAFRIQSGTFMHELGHNLGLRHGGGDGTARKPNYLSVMNYVFQTSWLRRGNTFVLDYSRFDFGADETALDEQHGFGVTSGPAGFWSEHACPAAAPSQFMIGADPVDWDCNGFPASSPVAVDANGDGAISVLPGHLDWPALRFDGGEVGAGARVQLATTPGGDEPPFSEVLAAARRITGAVAPTPAASPSNPTRTATTTTAAARPATVTALGIRPNRFRAARKRGHSLGSPRRARITYTLSRPSPVRFTVTRLRAGKKPTKIGGFRHVGALGKNVVGFTGRISQRPLKPGRYRLSARGGT